MHPTLIEKREKLCYWNNLHCVEKHPVFFTCSDYCSHLWQRVNGESDSSSEPSHAEPSETSVKSNRPLRKGKTFKLLILFSVLEFVA